MGDSIKSQKKIEIGHSGKYPDIQWQSNLNLRKVRALESIAKSMIEIVDILVNK